MKIKVSEATPTQLDWLVAKCEGEKRLVLRGGNLHYPPGQFSDEEAYNPSNSPEQAYPIIEREGISVIRCEDDYVLDRQGYCTNKRTPVWCATTGHYGTNSSSWGCHYDPQYEVPEAASICGPTPLIAAMRCYCCAKLGSEVEVPESLIES